WQAALSRVQQDEAGRQAMGENTKGFRAELERFNVRVPGRDQIVPVILGDDALAVAAALQLQKKGYDIRAIRSPSVPVDGACLRISLHADHDPSSLRRLAVDLQDILKA